MSYADIADSLGVPVEVVSCMRGAILPPEFTYDRRLNRSFGLPPAVLPIWSNGALPGYLGVLTQWFGGEKGISFALYFAESADMEEVAKNSDQFRVWLAFAFLCNVPDVPEVGAFAEKIGLCPAADVEAYFAGFAEQEDLLRLPVFRSDPPGLLMNRPNPTWVKPFSISSFDEHLRRGQLAEAWGVLNGPGWTPELVADGLSVLQPLVKDPRFDELIRCWKEFNGLP